MDGSATVILEEKLAFEIKAVEDGDVLEKERESSDVLSAASSRQPVHEAGDK